MNDYSFSSTPLKTQLKSSIQALGYMKMTPIQKLSLNHVLSNKDLIAQSETGSGKTVAFSLGILNKFDVKNKKTQAIILCPTRELSEQISKEIRRLGQFIANLKVVSLCGGSPIKPQIFSLLHGAHIVVGTPGRVEDHLKRKTLDLKFIKTLVLDEADRMLEMGFSEVLDNIISYTPQKRQTLLFSATFPENIKEVSQQYQKNAESVKIEQSQEKKKITQIFHRIEENKKKDYLSNFLNSHKPESTIVFCNTKKQTEDLANWLKVKGFSARPIHGDHEQKDRNETLVLCRNKSCSVLVATDVASRGVDIQSSSLVVNFECAKTAEVHVHRIGRTARAGRTGQALTLYTEREEHKIKAIEDLTQIKVKPQDLNKQSYKSETCQFSPPMVSFLIAAGKKNKLRPTDILGALTADKDILFDDVGKIDIFDFYSFVAIRSKKENSAHHILTSKPIKGRFIKVKKVCI